MQEKEHFLIGRVVRTHGLDGSLIVKLSEDLLLSHIPDYLLISIRNQKVPWFINHCETINVNSLLLKFDFVNNQFDAKPLVGCMVYAEKHHTEIKENLNGAASDMIGFSVIDKNMGFIGTVCSFILNSPQPVMEVAAGEKTILIPAINPILLKIDDSKQTVFIDAPAGLIEMYLNE